MAIRSCAGRTLSFDLLTSESSGDDKIFLPRSISYPIRQNGAGDASGSSPPPLENKQNRRRRRNKASKKKRTLLSPPPIDEDPIPSQIIIDRESDVNGLCPNGFESDSNRSVVCDPMISANGGVGSVVTEEIGVSEPDFRYLQASPVSVVELRQRSVNGVASESLFLRFDEPATDEEGMEASSSGNRMCEPPNGNVAGKLETAASLDWNRVMAENSKKMAENSNCKLFHFIFLF